MTWLSWSWYRLKAVKVGGMAYRAGLSSLLRPGYSVHCQELEASLCFNYLMLYATTSGVDSRARWARPPLLQMAVHMKP